MRIKDYTLDCLSVCPGVGVVIGTTTVCKGIKLCTKRGSLDNGVKKIGKGVLRATSVGAFILVCRHSYKKRKSKRHEEEVARQIEDFEKIKKLCGFGYMLEPI